MFVDSGDETPWQAKNGELIVHAPENDHFTNQGYLLTDRDYTDFRLRFQFQKGSDGAMSGVALTAVPCEKVRNSRPDGNLDMAFHLTVWIGKGGADDPTGGLWWSPDSGAVHPLFPEQLAAIRPVGEWNDMEIEMRGQLLRVAVNDRVVLNVKLNETRPTSFPAPGLNRYSGRLEFMNRAGEVRFRKIEIEEPVPSPTKGVRPGPPSPGPLPTMANSMSMKFVLIPAGDFLMGSPDGEGDFDEHPRHPVRFTRPFYLGKYEVTQGQYRAVMSENPSQFKWSDELPVENLTWIGAIRFCNNLSELEKRTPYYRIVGKEVTIAGGDGYRLPTEAEWEYAARAGTTTLFLSGDDAGKLGAYAWFEANSGKKTHLVGRKRANAWGLHDMVGNVYEWCGDWADANYYASSPKNGPPGPTKGSQRLIRGGGWFYVPGLSRPGDGWWMPVPETRFGCLGFRVALTRSGRDPESRDAAPDRKVSTPAASRPPDRALDVGSRADRVPGSGEPLAVRRGVGDIDRRAAESVLLLGGTAVVREADAEEVIKPGDRLPTASFRLVRVKLADNPDFDDAGLEPLRGLTSLVEIDLTNAKNLAEAGLERLKGLRQLEALRLRASSVTDAALVHLEPMTSLRHLDLFYASKLTTAAFPHLRGLTQLESLKLGGCEMTGAGLLHLEGLTNLRDLVLWDLRVTDGDLAHLESFGQLETLELVGLHQITDLGLAHLKGLTRLRKLSLYNCDRVTGAGLADPRALAQLRFLCLKWTTATDGDLAHLRNLEQLEWLELQRTKVSDAGLAHLRGLSQLKDLDLT